MSIKFIEKTPLKVAAGTKLFKKSEPVEMVGIVLQGVVEAISEYGKIQLSVASMVGLMDIHQGTYLYDYVVKEEVTIFPFKYDKEEDLDKIMHLGADYAGVMVANATSQTLQVLKFHEALVESAASLFEFLKEYNAIYENDCSHFQNSSEKSSTIIEQLEMIDEKYLLLDDGVEYFRSLSHIAADNQKQFFGASKTVSRYHVNVASRLVNKINESCLAVIKYTNQLIPLLADKGVDSLFSSFAKLAVEMGQAKSDNTLVLEHVSDVIEEISKIYTIYTETLMIPVGIDVKWIKSLYSNILNLSEKKSEMEEDTTNLSFKYAEKDIERAILETEHATNKILKYSGFDAEKQKEFKELLILSKSQNDNEMMDNENRKVRQKIASYFYEVYEKVFFRAEEEKNDSKLINLFLNFGFFDETLFDKEHLLELYYLEITPVKHQIYTIRQWLQAIFNGEKEPSVNEFEMDYKEDFRDQKRTRKFSPEEERAYLNDRRKKVHYEITNFFRLVNRMTSGHILSFSPILSQDSFVRDIKKTFVTKEYAFSKLESVLKIDYSAFYREQVYQDNEKLKEHVYIMKQILPDIILMPNVGSRGVMWQEISEKRRDTPARFVFPIFTIEDMQNLFIRVVGAFRWELCRTVQGVRWNDIRDKSLTSEYSDYVQFYRNNREIPAQTKDKIKLQLQKAKNSFKEMFVMDYENWIRYEAQGAIKLNKVAREIMFVYCPLSKEIRDRIAAQPAFADAAGRFQRERLKKVKEVTNRYINVSKRIGELPEILQDNINFYKDL